MKRVVLTGLTIRFTYDRQGKISRYRVPRERSTYVCRPAVQSRPVPSRCACSGQRQNGYKDVQAGLLTNKSRVIVLRVHLELNEGRALDLDSASPYGRETYLLETLFTTARTAEPVRELRLLAVIEVDDLLRVDCGQMNRPVTKVDLRLRIVDGESTFGKRVNSAWNCRKGNA